MAALHLEARPIWWYEVFNQKVDGLTQPELTQMGAPKMEGQYHISIKKLFSQ